MKAISSSFLALFAGLCGAQAAHAADDESVTFTVRGRSLALPPGTPAYGAQVIDRDAIDASVANRLEDVLSGVAGFQQFRRSDSRSSNPSAQGVTLRALGGNATSRALVLLDGVPQADPFFGYVPFSAIDPGRLSTIRVTRGGGVGAFGAGAVAGTIELFSALDSELAPWSAGASYGSRDAVELAAAAAPGLGDGFADISARYDRGDGFFTTPPDQRGPADVPARYESWSAAIRGVAPIGDALELQSRFQLADDRRTLRFRGADSSSSGADASIRLVGRGRWQFDVLGYVQARDFSNVVISATSFRPVLDQRATPSTGLGGKVEIRPPLDADSLLRLGLDTRLADGIASEDAISGVTGLVTARRRIGGETSTTGVFAEYDRTAGPWVLTAGVRLDRWTIGNGFFEQRNPAGALTIASRFDDRAGWRASGRAGALYRATSGITLRTAAYSGFRVPTLNELYRSFTVFPVTTLANQDLRLERLSGLEAGIDIGSATGFDLALTIFHNRLAGAIGNVTIGPNLRQRRNLDAIEVTGVELSGAYRRSALALDWSYAFNDSRVSARGEAAALDGLAPAQSPRHSASATASLAVEDGPSLSATLRYVGPQFEDDLETDVLPDFLTLGAVARVPLSARIGLSARVENLFDARIVTRNAGGSIDLGVPRTFWLGLSVTG